MTASTAATATTRCSAADGDDILLADAGADVLRGGSGLDTVNYSARTAPVRITLGGDDDIDDNDDVLAHDDGTYVRVDDDGDGEIDDDDPMETREGDDIGGDIEIARGGRGDDYIVGSYSRRGALRRRGRGPHRPAGRLEPGRRRRRRRLGCLPAGTRTNASSAAAATTTTAPTRTTT